MLVVRPGNDRGEQGDDMGTDIPGDTGTSTAQLQREVCDKCGSRMELESSAHGFERWKCPKCQQIIGIDRDPDVGSRFQIDRGQPWNYSPDAFKN
jgi:phage FluMu protein Com